MPFGGNFHPEWGALAPAPSFMRTARIVAVATAIGATAGAGVVLSLAGSSGALLQTSSEAASDRPLVIVHSLVQPAEAAPVAAQAAPSSAAVVAPVNVQAIAPAAAVPVVASASATPAAKIEAPLGAPIVVPASVAPSPATPSAEPPIAAPALPAPAAQASTPMPSDSHTASTPAVPASVAALAEIPAATEASPAPGPDAATVMQDQTGAPKSGGKKLHGTDQTQRSQAAAASSQKRRPEERGFGSLLRHLFSARAGSTSPN